MDYTGFWQRVIAAIIDYICLTIFAIGIGFVIGMVAGLIFQSEITPEMMTGMNTFLLGIGIYLLYEVMFTASAFRATPGKMIVNSVVVSPDGSRLSVTKALWRAIAKYLSSFTLLIGYIMVAFTDRKRGLHDMMAKTVVVKKYSLAEQLPV